jgi:hypothetical protein
MTSVLYSAGLNYQMGNPVRQEIVAIRRESESLRKQLEQLTEELLVYRKHMSRLLADKEVQLAEFQKDLLDLTLDSQPQKEVGRGTVQGGGFRR